MAKFNYKKEYEKLIDLLNDAYSVYIDTEKEKRQDKRAREALRIIGFTIDKRPVKMSCNKLLSEYRGILGELQNAKKVTPEEWKEINNAERPYQEQIEILHEATFKKITKQEKIEIINDMAKRHKTSYEAIHKKLRTAKSIHDKALKQVYASRPYELSKSIKWLSNILPPHK